MSIRAPRGTKVKLVHPNAGYDPDVARAKKHLTVGKVYTVNYAITYSWNTDVYLVEIPNVAFNSSMFEEVERRKKAGSS
jgi:hypothetical protein